MSRSKLFQQNIKNRLTSDSGLFLVSAHMCKYTNIVNKICKSFTLLTITSYINIYSYFNENSILNI